MCCFSNAAQLRLNLTHILQVSDIIFLLFPFTHNYLSRLYTSEYRQKRKRKEN